MIITRAFRPWPQRPYNAKQGQAKCPRWKVAPHGPNLRCGWRGRSVESSRCTALTLQAATTGLHFSSLSLSGAAGEFSSSPGSTFCADSLRYPFYPRVTAAVARKISRRLFCQKCRWQGTAKHAYTLRMWLCMKWHGAWLYGVHRTCAETAAVSCGTSHASAVSTPLQWIVKKRAIKLVTHVEPQASAVSLLKRAENSAI